MFELGMAYVALSRVRTLGGLALLNFESVKVKANKRVHEEMERLTGPQLRTLQSHCIDSGRSVKLKKWKSKSEWSSRALYEWIIGKRPSW